METKNGIAFSCLLAGSLCPLITPTLKAPPLSIFSFLPLCSVLLSPFSFFIFSNPFLSPQNHSLASSAHAQEVKTRVRGLVIVQGLHSELQSLNTTCDCTCLWRQRSKWSLFIWKNLFKINSQTSPWAQNMFSAIFWICFGMSSI